MLSGASVTAEARAQAKRLLGAAGGAQPSGDVRRKKAS
jgi:hypothetical protein